MQRLCGQIDQRGLQSSQASFDLSYAWKQFATYYRLLACKFPRSEPWLLSTVQERREVSFNAVFWQNGATLGQSHGTRGPNKGQEWKNGPKSTIRIEKSPLWNR